MKKTDWKKEMEENQKLAIAETKAGKTVTADFYWEKSDYAKSKYYGLPTD